MDYRLSHGTPRCVSGCLRDLGPKQDIFGKDSAPDNKDLPSKTLPRLHPCVETNY